MVALVTPRLLLRRWTDDDLDPYAEICADREVMAHIGDGNPRSREETEASIKVMEASWERNEFGIFAVERLDDQRLIGFCGLAIPDFLPEILPAVEVGWRLARDQWGRGLATEAAQAVLDWTFETVVLQRVVAVIAVNNAQSRNLAERLAMTHERRTMVTKHNVWADVYEITEATWAARASSES